MVELADTGGLNPPFTQVECGFKSRPGHVTSDRRRVRFGLARAGGFAISEQRQQRRIHQAHVSVRLIGIDHIVRETDRR